MIDDDICAKVLFLFLIFILFATIIMSSNVLDQHGLMQLSKQVSLSKSKSKSNQNQASRKFPYEKKHKEKTKRKQ